MGRDRIGISKCCGSIYFNPRAPYGARPPRTLSHIRRYKYFNPRAPYGARRVHLRLRRDGRGISIHAPRMGRDCKHCFYNTCNFVISIHAPRMGRDTHSSRPRAYRRYFNPRAPYGARLPQYFLMLSSPIFQSTRPVWGATHVFMIPICTIRISIHAPRMGRDIDLIFIGSSAPHFNPRAPYGARLRHFLIYYNHKKISIHAPRMGRDCMTLLTALTSRLFQSTRPVWGATLVSLSRLMQKYKFQSTRPVWGATIALGVLIGEADFNPRAPYGARHHLEPIRNLNRQYFNPRAPYGARLCKAFKILKLKSFQSTRPVWGATLLLY